jgi:poly-gamma-glutamate capsule biosynthesis protein CapA/YwtB (metallophosphatase superfamily)
MHPPELPSLVLWESKPHQPSLFKVAVAGDFLPGGELTVPDGSTWESMAGGVAKYFQDVVISIANLEGPLEIRGLLPRPKAGPGQNLGAPEAALDYLQAVNAAVVGLANNHIYDFGPEGVERTRRAILARGMIPLGGGRTLQEAPEVFVWRGPGKAKVGFWAASVIAADLASPNAEGAEPATMERARLALKMMSDEGATCRIALLHAGLERTNRPDPEDVAFMDSLAAEGFDLVAGCHSHRISGYKIVHRSGGRPAFCFHGLGSLTSGIIYSPREREGVVVVAGLGEEGMIERVEVRPVYLAGSGWGSVPSAREAEIILERFKAVSQEIADGSYRKVFYQDMGQDLVRRQIRDTLIAYRRAGVRGVANKLGRLRMRHIRRLVHKLTG